jgi:hypothetical protein
VAKLHKDYDILVTHFDGGNSSKKVLKEHFEPARDRDLIEKEKARNEDVCQHVLPSIPIREIEAWMLADSQALRTALNTRLNDQDLNLPKSPKSVENITDPKWELKEILKRVNVKRSANQAIALSELYNSLGKTIGLEKLEQVPAYQNFVEDLTKALQETGFIR